jgi:hypothetical protein
MERKAIKALYIKTRRDTLNEMLSEIKEHDFLTAHQVIGLIHTLLDITTLTELNE